MEGEDIHQWVCAAKPGLLEGAEDMQVQGRGDCSVPLVAWPDQEGGPGHLSPLLSMLTVVRLSYCSIETKAEQGKCMAAAAWGG